MTSSSMDEKAVETVAAEKKEEQEVKVNNDESKAENKQTKGKKKKRNQWWDRKKKKGSGSEEGSEEGKKRVKHYRRTDSGKTERHSGSFSNPDMQKQFDITLDNFKATESTSGDSDEGSKSSRNPKKKVAMLVAFLGEAYAGMQMNAEQNTIQAQLELAIYRAGFLSDANFGFPTKYSWSNSARTDKGVHSCAQVCSGKLAIPKTFTFPDVKIAINEHLPTDIRVLDVIKVTRNFCAKTSRDKVRYQYMLPSFLLQPTCEIRKLFEEYGCHKNDLNGSEPLTPDQISSLSSTLTPYRTTPETLQLLQKTLNAFQGTHSFHNYTNGKNPNDPSCQRYIISFSVQPRAVIAPDGTEWIVTQVLGQSFLLHHIRKMMSVAIDVTRGVASLRNLERSLESRKMIVGVAPAQGLFLEMSFFDLYNKRKAVDNVDCRLDWDSLEEGSEVKHCWKEFKEGTVMKHVMRQEEMQHNFLRYLFLQEFRFDRGNYSGGLESEDKMQEQS